MQAGVPCVVQDALRNKDLSRQRCCQCATQQPKDQVRPASPPIPIVENEANGEIIVRLHRASLNVAQMRVSPDGSSNIMLAGNGRQLKSAHGQ